jgi:hypothetical protein
MGPARGSRCPGGQRQRPPQARGADDDRRAGVFQEDRQAAAGPRRRRGQRGAVQRQRRRQFPVRATVSRPGSQQAFPAPAPAASSAVVTWPAGEPEHRSDLVRVGGGQRGPASCQLRPVWGEDPGDSGTAVACGQHGLPGCTEGGGVEVPQFAPASSLSVTSPPERPWTTSPARSPGRPRRTGVRLPGRMGIFDRLAKPDRGQPRAPRRITGQRSSWWPCIWPSPPARARGVVTGGSDGFRPG